VTAQICALQSHDERCKLNSALAAFYAWHIDIYHAVLPQNGKPSNSSRDNFRKITAMYIYGDILEDNRAKVC